MRKKIFVAVIFIFMAQACFADLIYLKDGSMIEGEIISQDASGIQVSDGQKVYKIPAEKVKKISRQGNKTARTQEDAASLLPAITASNFSPTQKDMTMVQYNAYKAISEMKEEVKGIHRENEQVKQIMIVELGIIAVAAAVGIIVYSNSVKK